MTFGEKIKYARKKMGLTQRELGKLIDAKHNSISDWENNKNKPNPDTIELLCGVLDISPSYLLGVEEPKPTISKYEEMLLTNCTKLNSLGKSKLLEYSEDLTSNPKYIDQRKTCELTATIEEEDDYLMPIAAHNDNTNDEQLEKMKRDIERIKQLKKK